MRKNNNFCARNLVFNVEKQCLERGIGPKEVVKIFKLNLELMSKQFFVECGGPVTYDYYLDYIVEATAYALDSYVLIRDDVTNPWLTDMLSALRENLESVNIYCPDSYYQIVRNLLEYNIVNINKTHKTMYTHRLSSIVKTNHETPAMFETGKFIYESAIMDRYARIEHVSSYCPKSVAEFAIEEAKRRAAGTP